MPRLFTAIEVPPEVARDLSLHRGGLPGARWIEPESFHVTLRFLGDVDHATARDAAEGLAELRPRAPIEIAIDALDSFGGDRPRSIHARVVPNAELTRLQVEQEKLMRAAGLEPETRKFTPHVTLARLQGARATDVAAYLARVGHVPRRTFVADRFALMSARSSRGGGPYVVEATYPFGFEADP